MIIKQRWESFIIIRLCEAEIRSATKNISVQGKLVMCPFGVDKRVDENFIA